MAGMLEQEPMSEADDSVLFELRSLLFGYEPNELDVDRWFQQGFVFGDRVPYGLVPSLPRCLIVCGDQSDFLCNGGQFIFADARCCSGSSSLLALSCFFMWLRGKRVVALVAF